MSKSSGGGARAAVSELTPILNRISLLGGLSESQLSEVVAHMETESYSRGDYVFRQGDEPNAIYVVRSGKIKIVVDVGETTMELVEYGVGQCFGETSAIGILPHSASAYVTEDADLVVLTRQALHELFHENPKTFGMVVLNIAREACRRLQQTDKVFLHYASSKPHNSDRRYSP